MKLVILESPYRGSGPWPLSLIRRWANVRYARAALRDCLLRGESPIASHLLLTQPGVLDDADPEERRMGIEAGLAWGELADATVVYVDRGISEGMRLGIAAATRDYRPVENRSLIRTETAPRRAPGGRGSTKRDQADGVAV